jgi:3-deoxy-D-manno-octulosonate 8-phosphate phosphatase (KDO 8-P phosphatase)
MRDDIFTSKGAKFITPPAKLQEKLLNVKALLFDWDGVFNSGEKGGMPSSFNEVDSMGINMLRFGYYMIHGHIPYTAIVTGETNQAGFRWAGRERFDNVFFQVKNKVELLPILKHEQGLEPDEVLFVFDDVLDLSLAKAAGARFLVNRESNPLFNAFCIKNNLCDYLTFSSGSENAIREVSEVVLDGIGKFENAIEERIYYDGDYADFLEEKMAKQTLYRKAENGSFPVTEMLC